MHPKHYILAPFVKQDNIGVIGLADKDKNCRYITVYNTFNVSTYLPFYDQKKVRLITVANYYD